MKLLVVMFLICGCSRDCDVWCGPLYCTVNYSDKFELSIISNRLDNMTPKEANGFCIEYKGLNKRLNAKE